MRHEFAAAIRHYAEINGDLAVEFDATVGFGLSLDHDYLQAILKKHYLVEYWQKWTA